MIIHDISMTIEEAMPVYKNSEEKRPIFTNSSNFETANHYESKITMDMHTGTHIDAPLHMIKNGEKMESYKLEDFVTKAKVIDLAALQTCITKEDIEDKDIKKGDFILFKTRNSYRNDFDNDFVYLERTAAAYLNEIGVTGVGIDALGIERAQPDHDSHKALLGNRIIILEGLRLKAVNEGSYTLVAVPLKILHTEAAPTRAILIEGNL